MTTKRSAGLGKVLVVAVCILAALPSAAQWDRRHMQDETLPHLYSVHFNTPATGLACGTGGTAYHYGVVMHTSDSGNTWQEVYENEEVDFFAVYAVSATRWVAAGNDDSNNASIWYSENAGQDWQEASIPAGGSSIGTLQFTDENTGFATGHGIDAYALKTTDGGKSWFRPSLIQGFLPYTAHFLDSLNGYVMGMHHINRPATVRTTDGGLTWTFENSKLPGFGGGVSFVSATTGYAAMLIVDSNFRSEEIRIFKTEDAGATWNQIATQTLDGENYGVLHMKFVNEGTGYIMLYDEDLTFIRKTQDGGLTWSDMPLNLSLGESYAAFDFPEATRGVAVGSFGVYGLYKEGVSSIAPLAGRHGLNIYPNPVNGEVLNIIMSEAMRGTATLTDMTGRVVWSDSNLNLREGQNTIALPYNALQQGVYHLSITGNGAVYGSRLSVVQ